MDQKVRVSREADIANVIYLYGEEPKSRRIARAIEPLDDRIAASPAVRGSSTIQARAARKARTSDMALCGGCPGEDASARPLPGSG